MREPRERTRPPISNMFESEKRREIIQKEIERAQLLMSDSAEHEVDAGSKQDVESNEGEELEKVRNNLFSNYLMTSLMSSRCGSPLVEHLHGMREVLVSILN